MRIRTERIRAGVVPVETWNPASAEEDVFRYVDISSVDRESKSILGVTELAVDEAPSRARQLLKANDVLVSTVRPNLNAVAIVPDDFDGAVGSTGFSVLRANQKRLLPQYLFHWVRTPMFVADMVKKATGASYPAVSDRIVLDSEIPAPPLAEQRRIADILDKADAIRRKRKEAIALTEELLRSAFLDMFGDPVTNPKGWPVMKVEDLCAAIVDCPHTTPKYGGDARLHPCVRTSDLQGGFFDWSTTKYVGAEEYRERIARLTPSVGDVLYTREGERYGIAAIIPDGVQACLGQRMMLLRPDAKNATSEFLWALMNSAAVYRQARAEVGGSTSPHVNVKAIRQFQAVRPPLDLQRQYSRACHAAFRGRSREIEALAEAGDLFNALVARAFSGALEAT